LAEDSNSDAGEKEMLMELQENHKKKPENKTNPNRNSMKEEERQQWWAVNRRETKVSC
jgi:hypothetical protein